MKEKTLLYIILGVITVILFSQVFTSKTDEKIAFAMPKLSLPKLKKQKKDVANTDNSKDVKTV